MLCHIPGCVYLNRTRDHCYMSFWKDVGVLPDELRHAISEMLLYNPDLHVYFECCNKQPYIHKNIQPVEIPTGKITIPMCS